MSAPPRPYFALVREDPSLERSLAADTQARRIAVVCSGGCTALSLLSDEVDEVVAIDVSPAQTALLSLRAAAVARLDRDEALRFTGSLPGGARAATYAHLRGELPEAARAYWDALPEAIAEGIDRCGVTEAFYRYVSRSLRASDWPDEVWLSLLAASSLAEQRALYQKHFADARFRIALEMLLSRAAHELFYPPAIFANAAEHDFARFFARRFQALVAEQPVRGNYFVTQLLFERHATEIEGGTPPYLSHEGYAAARRNLHKLRVVTGSLQETLRPGAGFDAFFLSNVLDWASPQAASQLGGIVRAAARPGAALLLRHMLGRPGVPDSFGATLDAARGEQALREERAFLYGAISVGRIG